MAGCDASLFLAGVITVIISCSYCSKSRKIKGGIAALIFFHIVSEPTTTDTQRADRPNLLGNYCYCANPRGVWRFVFAPALLKFGSRQINCFARRRLFVSQRSKLASFDCVCFLTFSTKQKVEFLVILSSFKHTN
jgi:hypothetical protein